MFADPTSTTQPDAVSAVKALQKAAQAGKRIYHITQTNQTTALAAINHDADTMAEIRASLAIGKEVVTHTDSISVPGWSGAGYIILDPHTGDGSYKIAGGGNGGFLALLGFFLMAAIIMGPVIGFVGSAVFIFFGKSAVLLVMSLWAAAMAYDASNKMDDGELKSILRQIADSNLRIAKHMSTFVRTIVSIVKVYEWFSEK